MNNPAKGGRGKRAPYNTVMSRVPEPIKSLAEELSAKYRELVNDYENPDDPALIAAVKKAIAPGRADNVTAENQQVKKLLQEYEQMQAEMEQLRGQVEKLKSTNNRDISSKTVLDFIEYKKSVYIARNGEFSLNTRSWDAFRDFMEFIQPEEELKSLDSWKVGDKCSVKMPSGVIITEAEIASIQANGNCKISVPITNSHFPSDLADLIRE